MLTQKLTYLTRTIIAYLLSMSSCKRVFLLFIFLVPLKGAIQVDLYEKIKELAKQKHISIKQLEETLKMGNGTIRRWDKNSPSVEKVQQVADFFNVSIYYLLGKEELKVYKEPIDLADLVDESKVNWDDWVSFDGKPLNDDVKTALKVILGKRLED